MLLAGKAASDEKSAEEMLRRTIEDGSALKKLAQFVKAQGGCEEAVYHPEMLPKASMVQPVLAEEEGYLNHIDCDEVGICSLLLGGGRETKESEIDLSVGLVLEKKVGAYVRKGDVLAYIHANDENKAKAACARFIKACHIGAQKPKELPFIRDIIS